MFDGQFYLGSRVGFASKLETCSNLSVSCNESTGEGISVGYSFNDWISLQTDITNYGEWSGHYVGGSNSASINGIELSAKLSFPLVDEIDLTSRIGGSYILVDAKRYTDTISTFDSDSIAPFIAAGLEVPLSPNIALTTEIQYFDGIDTQTYLGSDLLFTSFGVIYKFDPPIYHVSDNDELLARASKSNIESKNINNHCEFYFERGSSKITQSCIDQHFFKSAINARKIVVTGHTDSVGHPANNKKLSLRRAFAIKEHLAFLGVDKNKILLVGMGETEPKASNMTEEGRILNRRVEVDFYN